MITEIIAITIGIYVFSGMFQRHAVSFWKWTFKIQDKLEKKKFERANKGYIEIKLN